MKKAKRERLIKLMEECSEVIQIGSKILQYGYKEYSPSDKAKGLNNKQRLQNEIRDMFFWLNEMNLRDDVDLFDCYNRLDEKKDKAAQYTQYQKWSKWRKE